MDIDREDIGKTVKTLCLNNAIKVGEDMGIKTGSGKGWHQIYNEEGELVDLDLDEVLLTIKCVGEGKNRD